MSRRQIPLVSCILPTRDRRLFVSQAIRYFLRQNYPHRELIVVDDGADPIADLLPDVPGISYLRPCNRMSLGAKRNLACAAATGSLIMHWDDDDWMSPWRIAYQVQHLLRERAQVCGLREVVHLDPIRRRSWRFTYPPRARAWVAGGTLCYTKALWERNRFDDIEVAEDSAFLWRRWPGRVLALPDDSFYVAILHPGNTSAKPTSHPWWRPIEPEPVLERLGSDRQFYAELAGRLAPAPQPRRSR